MWRSGALTNMIALSVLSYQARPAGWCVAGPGSMAGAARARHVASTSRPTFASALWACGWCGRPPALPEALCTGGRVNGQTVRIALTIFDLCGAKALFVHGDTPRFSCQLSLTDRYTHVLLRQSTDRPDHDETSWVSGLIPQ